MKYNNAASRSTPIWPFVTLFVITTSICWFSHISYLSQAIAGYFRIINTRRPIESTLEANDLDYFWQLKTINKI